MKFNKKIILASKSPRRLEILKLAGIEPEVYIADADEGSVEFSAGEPGKYVRDIAKLKNDAAFAALSADTSATDTSAAEITAEELAESVIVSADTVVYSIDGDATLGKPRDFDDACRMLRSLSGKVHRVVSGVMIRDCGTGRISSFEESTDVTFRALTDDEIEDYVREARPYDKAGAYGIQEGACVFVSRIEGDYYNVVGLPICRLAAELDKLT